jgi:hypothetical protein
MVPPPEKNTLVGLISIMQDPLNYIFGPSDSKKIVVQVIPRMRSQRTIELMVEAGTFQMCADDQVLEFAVLNPDGSRFFRLDSSLHESWTGGYESYVRHVQEEVEELRASGFIVEYSHFEIHQDKFIQS